ncbi:hypothetical protein BH23CYA1_BH23CYA1_07140 [soil metagenome]
MNRGLYSDNWERMAFDIKQAANWTCEGCGRPCLRPGESVAAFVQRIADELPLWLTFDPAHHPRRFLLSVAHLDHLPQNSDRANLKAWCCHCHCRYDLAQMNRKKRLKAEREGQLSMLPGGQSYRLDPNRRSGGDERSFTQPLSQSRLVAVNPVENAMSRQHRPKGKASGWIEERMGNQKRKNPSTSHYYRWDSPRGRVNEYIRASRVTRIHQLIDDGLPALEVLRAVVEGKKRSRLVAELLGE